jgi:hypothetical protein
LRFLAWYGLVSWTLRTFNLPYRHINLSSPEGVITVPAESETSPPECESPCIELCTLQAYARCPLSDASVDVESAVVAVLQHVPPTSVADRSPGAGQPDARCLLAEFFDVLVHEIPGPAERVGVDGKPIESGIDTA